MSRADHSAGGDRSPKATVARRLSETGLATDRFIDVENGGKKSTDHTQVEASKVSGNYGVYAGRELVLIDIDDYDGSHDLGPIDGLRDTLTVGTPNGGEHRYYHVPDAPNVFEDRFGVKNPVTEWGEIRVHNQYVVGPGSTNPDGDARDEYIISDNCSIAQISAHVLVGAIRATGYDTSDDSTETDSNKSDAPTGDVSLDDADLLEKAKSGKNGNDFTRLWNGDTAGYQSHSEADLALCNHLAFWTGNDRSRINSLFRQSGLYREKWNRDDYRERTIKKAVKGTSETYNPKGSTGETTLPEPNTPLADAIDSSWFDLSTKTVRVSETDDYTTDELTNLFQKPENLDKEQKTAVFEVSGGDDWLFNPDGWKVEARTPERYTHNGIGFNEMSTRELKQAALESLPTHRVAYVPQREEWFWCDESTNVWQPHGDEDLRQWLDSFFGPFYSRHVRNEVMDQLKARVRKEETVFGGGPAGKIAVRDRVVNLETGEIVGDVQPVHYVRWSLSLGGQTFDPKAECPHWKKFLGGVAEPSDIPLLQEFIGYTLMHWDLPHKKALILLGPTDAGKSVFLDVIRGLFGGNESAATSSTSLQYLANERWGPARLVNSALNIRNDLDEHTIENTGKVKEIIGGDTLDAEYKRKPVFQFAPVAKHIFAANRAPNRSTDDEAFWNRWLTVIFPESVPREYQNPNLTNELLAELPGILNWAIEGYQRLQKQGHFTDQPQPWQNREKWERYGNSIEQWLDRFTEIDENAFTPKRTVGDILGAYDSYKVFARTNNLEIESDKKFTAELKRKPQIGYKQKRVGGERPRCYTNLKLTDDAPEPDFGDSEGDEPDDHNSGLGDFEGDDDE